MSQKDYKLKYPIIFLFIWCVLWLPYYIVFILGNPPIEVFSLYEVVNSNRLIKVSVAFAAIAGELSLMLAILIQIFIFLKNVLLIETSAELITVVIICYNE